MGYGLQRRVLSCADSTVDMRGGKDTSRLETIMWILSGVCFWYLDLLDWLRHRCGVNKCGLWKSWHWKPANESWTRARARTRGENINNIEFLLSWWTRWYTSVVLKVLTRSYPDCRERDFINLYQFSCMQEHLQRIKLSSSLGERCILYGREAWTKSFIHDPSRYSIIVSKG